ncbi:HTTM domain-containing protein [Pedobacter arcticus]|uniref:HTTM domain-containing protein n=1 Tax=Pedobacter arcticus TaxID=752140 RepID=UPI0002F59248|nr:HTTM domain-containing protein [Pedobacter arcticus]
MEKASVKTSGYYFSALKNKLSEPIDAASLAFFRILFGCIMLFSQVRFLSKGWVDLFYIQPKFFFKYFGFHWVQALPGNWMYLPWVLMVISLVFIIVGKYYRFAIVVFFFLFSYTELLDLSNYLNHYYLITLLAFAMIFLPMNVSFSLDAKKWQQPATVPRWTLSILRLQIGLVYFFAGVSKIKYDWLIMAQPLKTWLLTCQNIPWVGKFLSMPFTAYVFSWGGMFFDISAPFLLLNKKTRPFEYALIVFFHLVTFWLFYIGVFPIVMIGVALVFFSSAFHRRFLEKYFFWLQPKHNPEKAVYTFTGHKEVFSGLFIVYFLWQFLMPLRYLMYKGNVMWTEQGYRYAWNVMLMEKDAVIYFYVEDKETGERFIEYPKKYLTPLQERMMSTQPDMILQYAHFLAAKYQDQLKHSVAVYADAYASLNAKAGQTFIDPDIDLANQKDSFAPKYWIMPESTDHEFQK